MASGPADKVMDVFQSLVWDELVKLAITQIVGLAPFLAWGPISFIVGKVVTYIAGVLYEALKETINFQVIILKHEAHHKAFVTAQLALRSIAETKGIDSDEFKNARIVHAAALRKFVRYPNS
jgi:hypothetical protein